ncbi:hypothetical protein [Chitinophaga pinensis]|uniref:hypothetical protein n=1 Tax=Chitinophaga pinensis TaxID=79329 RepID=UPI0016452BA9|nr:hypothetical protein [Chitinophaga pinensis]
MGQGSGQMRWESMMIWKKRQLTGGFDQLRKDAKYANAIQTNYPEKLLAYLRKKGLHK